jgi:dihydroorotate dehydrogenase (fumarate)
MASLATSYLGLKLRNPLVVSSSSLTDSLDKLQRLQEAGAGAVVLKSIFEEQIQLDSKAVSAALDATADSSAEATSYFADIDFEVGPAEYLKLIEQARKSLSIPVIASLNCLHKGNWGDFAKKIESAGAQALELNIYSIQTDLAATSEKIERDYLDIVGEVRKAVKLPLSVKLSPFFTSIPHMVGEVAKKGANAVTLFNRFYQPNLDLENMTVASRLQLSKPEDALLPLRWIALLFGRVPNLEFAATGGIHDGKTALKMITAGASVAMVCSAIFKHKEKHLGEMLKEMEAWLKEKDYGSVDEVRGILSQKTNPQPQAFERSQYIKMLVGFD